MENHNGIVASEQYEKLKSYPTLPAIGQSDSNVFLAGNGSFLVPARNADVASQSQNGLMSKEDKQKLDGIASGAQVNSVTGVKGNAENSFRTGDINLTPANIGAASSDHNHDSSYAAKSHSHSDYAAVNHNHDSIYAAKSHSHSNASSSANGFMSAADKKKLDGIENAAQVNTVTGIKGNNETAYRTGSVNLTPANIGASPVGHGNHVPETQTANNAVFLRNDNTWQTVTPANIGAAASNHNHDSTYAAKSHTHDYAATNHTHSAATTVAGGFMSADDKKKLNGIAAGAQVNSVTGIKGNSESAYRTGNVNLTAANIGAATSSHTHNYAGSASAGGSASSAVKLDGFTQSTSQTWGQQAGTFINGMLDGDGGSMAWRKNCPSTGKTSYILDGLFYQNEGTYPCLDTSYLPLSIARGGTGATSAANARTNLGAAASDHNHNRNINILPPDASFLSPFWHLKGNSIVTAVNFIKGVGNINLPVSRDNICQLPKNKLLNLIKAGALNFLGSKRQLLDEYIKPDFDARINAVKKKIDKFSLSSNSLFDATTDSQNKKIAELNAQLLSLQNEYNSIVNSDNVSDQLDVLGFSFDYPFDKFDINYYDIYDPHSDETLYILCVVCSFKTSSSGGATIIIETPERKFYSLFMFASDRQSLNVNSFYALQVLRGRILHVGSHSPRLKQ